MQNTKLAVLVPYVLVSKIIVTYVSVTYVFLSIVNQYIKCLKS